MMGILVHLPLNGHISNRSNFTALFNSEYKAVSSALFSESLCCSCELKRLVLAGTDKQLSCDILFLLTLRMSFTIKHNWIHLCMFSLFYLLMFAHAQHDANENAADVLACTLHLFMLN